MRKILVEQEYLLDQMRYATGEPLPLPLMVTSPIEHVRDRRLTTTAMIDELCCDPARRVVIVGDAGAGKSMLSVLLTVALARRRRDSPEGHRAHLQVPVRVEANGWDASQHITFARWLADQLVVRYRCRRAVADALVDNDVVLPIVDGVDQMDTSEPLDRAAALFGHLNHAPWDRRAVVVVCRTDALTRIRDRAPHAGLHGARTYHLEPLTATEIYDRLQQRALAVYERTAPWDPVLDRLVEHPEGALATTLRTPLMLTMAATALDPDHGSVDATHLATLGDPAAIRVTLYAARIPAAVAAAPRRARTINYNAPDVTRWLTSFARFLEEQRQAGHDSTGLTLDQVWKLAGWRGCMAVHALIATALTVGVLTITHLLGDPQSPFGKFSLVSVYTMMLIAFYAADFTLTVSTFRTRIPGLRGTTERLAWSVPGRRRWRRALQAGGWTVAVLTVPVGTILAIVFVAFAATAAEMVPAVAASLIALGVIAAVAGGVTGLTTTGDERLSLGQAATRTIRDDLLFAVFAAAASSAILTVGDIAVTLILGLATAPATLTRDAVSTAVVGGSVVWFVVGLTATRHLAATLVFRIGKQFAPRPARFLDWASRGGLLRLRGTTYQFDHDTYQRWLATGDTTDGGR